MAIVADIFMKRILFNVRKDEPQKPVRHFEVVLSLCISVKFLVAV